MGQRTSETSLSDDIDDFFEPMLGDALDDDMEDEAPVTSKKHRLAELRRRAELRMEEKRMREELDYMELDWD
ncbi:MAG: hypothetical protein V2J89_11140 [Halieaceae bacterium]|jgi:hypothetical protein|nr:hypothetical protein [Halieaceae bacterium]